ncbi:MAG TPA: hypothetical protein VFJ16_28955 [Longimicrobium sp.]|nr:hypothetical protein [Longimicrobium sp.]
MASKPIRRVEPEGFPPPEHPAAYLVWTADSLHAAQTVWLDTAGAVVATRPGVYIAAGSHLWRWVNARKRVQGVDCQCISAKEHEDWGGCMVRQPAGIAYLRDLTGGAPRVWVLEASNSDGWAVPVQTAQPLASAGPYLITSAEGDYDGCGAHNLPSSWRMVFDLARGDTIEIADTLGVYERDSAAAVAVFSVDMGMGPESEQDHGPGSVDGFEFQWTRAGRLQGGYRFYVGACFACSDEGMSYGRTTLVADPVLPRWVRPWAGAPGPVRAYWRTDPRLRAGWRHVRTWATADSPWRYHSWFRGPGLRTGWSAVEPAHAVEMLAHFAPPPASADSASAPPADSVSPPSSNPSAGRR